ncbi:MAG: ribosomal L7Ae/L30e/S12e/Gadd45 family protein [Lachnospiraceae bacterium]|nr:ribosomal L7Ae/L30e/S12e/Gadd45 family protein [Lachnospiraceae bacterium]
MPKPDRVLQFLSLAQRAGKVMSGEFQTESTVKAGKAALVILAEDASENTKKKFTDLCKYHEVPLCFYSDREGLGRAIGKDFRASLAVSDPGFAEELVKKITEVG